MKGVARIAAALSALCVLLLLVDLAVATWRAPKDDKLVKALQKQVKQDASFAPKLEAEQKRITAARLGRRQRGEIAAWTLLVATSIFLAAAHKLEAKRARRAPEPAKLVEIAPAAARRERTPAPPAPEIDLAFVDDAVARLGKGPEAAIPLLQAIQQHYRYLPDEALRRLCEITAIKPAQIAGTSSFYGQFRRSPVGKHIVKVCHGTACHVAGARQLTDELRRHLQIAEGADTDAARTFTVEEVACLGCCSLAPVLMVDEKTAGRLTPATACGALEKAL